MATKNKMSSEAWQEHKKNSPRTTERLPVKKGKPNTRRERRKAEREAHKNAKV